MNVGHPLPVPASLAGVSANTATALMATSIAPRMKRLDKHNADVGGDIQKDCIRSLRDGFGHVVAFNFTEEIDGLRPVHDGVEWVDVGSRDQCQFARPMVDFRHVWADFKERDAPVFGVANSDVFIGDDPAYAAHVIRHAREGLVCFNRSEVGNLADRFGPAYSTGFDLFVFGRRVLEAVNLDGLAFGVPWWDYALPVMAAQAGIPIFRGDPGFVRHYSHDVAWSQDDWLSGLRTYMGHLRAQADALPYPSPLVEQMARIVQQFANEGTLQPLYGTDHIYKFGTMFAFWNVGVVNDAAITI
ncbi:MAG: hypothetical protein AAGD34_02845 [Pseudomonadota bacterium]